MDTADFVWRMDGACPIRGGGGSGGSTYLSSRASEWIMMVAGLF